MRITLGVTDNDWAAYLRAHDEIIEANFWVPSGRNFMGRATIGEPFLFKTKSPRAAIVGGGFYEHFWELRVSEAWSVFGHGNGVASVDELHAKIQNYRERANKAYMPDPTIGCVALRNLFFAPSGADLPPPERWGRSIVQGKTYDSSDPDFGYVSHAFNSLQGGARIDWMWDTDLYGVEIEVDERRFGEPVLTRPRLGQAGFKASLLDAYGGRCAVTDSKITPILEAAHIRPYASGGRHEISNGLLLRSDVHKLYDGGYLGVDVNHRLRVSPRLRTDFGNGTEFYHRETAGTVIALPSRSQDHPDRDALVWHMDTVFKSA